MTTDETEEGFIPSNQLVTNEESTSPPPYSIENGIDNPAYNPEGKIAKENMWIWKILVMDWYFILVCNKS